MKKFLSVLICLALLFFSSFPVLAAPLKIVDDAGLLTAEQITRLEAKAQTLSEKYQIDLVIVTVWSLDGKTSEAYADDYFDYNGYGIGNDRSGVLLLLAMEYRDWAISTCGQTIHALTDHVIQSVFSAISGYLADDEYYLAFDAYLDALVTYLKNYANGTPIDDFASSYTGPGIYTPGAQDEVIYYDEETGFHWSWEKFLIALVMGIITAGVTLLIMVRQMNTARKQQSADSYMKSGSYALNQQSDLFLYSQVRKVRRSENTSSGHHGGGSSVHRSSNGRSHGGGHGKF